MEHVTWHYPWQCINEYFSRKTRFFFFFFFYKRWGNLNCKGNNDRHMAMHYPSRMWHDINFCSNRWDALNGDLMKWRKLMAPQRIHTHSHPLCLQWRSPKCFVAPLPKRLFYFLGSQFVSWEFSLESRN